jgi:valyl-tRNA synthetase
MPEKFLKPYDPQAVEANIYKKWEESGYFNPDNLPPLRQGSEGQAVERTEPFSIVLPPPNVTGTLHMGHAAMLAVEDTLVRYNRMLGKKTLWVPGTDSAAIATQAKVEDILYKEEKLTRHDIGREALLERIEKFTDESKATILNQVRRMGASLDWSRYAYTMDEQRYGAVMEAFVRMYDAGLIYRGDRIVNWDPKMQTTVSDDEVEYKEQKDPFYTFKYGPFEIGTVRPETKFGDKYVVMHPEDERYKEYEHGQKIELEWINGPITATVIKDEAIDMNFGTGVMTITPAHSEIDFEIAKRHGLDIESVIDERGILLPIAGEFEGQHIKKARPLIVEKLKEKGLLVKVDEGYVNNIATNSRGGGTIEPQIKRQWFIAVDKEFEKNSKKTTLKKAMRDAVESGEVKIIPEHFEKIYYHWINNLHDWCISRQIWFGHRIPVWYKGDEIYCGTTQPEGTGWIQDPDTLDTWFSSGLWTFSTLGWPNETQDLKTYHPTSLLETGYDILFFWVARMILMSSFLIGEVPFKNVYLHGLVRDGQGRKMSKSLGNIIDPLTMIDKYGTDAVRLSLIMGVAPGNDLKLSEDRIRGYKNFANKVWNITRFVLESYHAKAQADAKLHADDAAIIEEAKVAVASATKNIEEFRLDLAMDTLYQYIWHQFADVTLEESKPLLRGDDAARAASRAQALYETLTILLRALHPFMPFVTEEIWSSFAKATEGHEPLLMVENWPVR